MNLQNTIAEKTIFKRLALCLVVCLGFALFAILESFVLSLLSDEYIGEAAEFSMLQASFGLTASLLVAARGELRRASFIQGRKAMLALTDIAPLIPLIVLGRFWGPIQGRIFGMMFTVTAVFYFVMFIFLYVSKDSGGEPIYAKAFKVVIVGIFGFGAGLFVSGGLGVFYYGGGVEPALFTDIACMTWCPRMLFLSVNAAVLSPLICMLRGKDADGSRLPDIFLYIFLIITLVFVAVNLFCSFQNSIFAVFFGRF